MNRFYCLIAIGVMLVAPWAVADGSPQGLGRTFAKLKQDHSLTIGYFGGSITAGAGASKPEFNWRMKTTAWFKQAYPEAKITEINAAIGGTGSDLGAFRCQNDLLSKMPDLVFVEYAVNDGGGAEDRIKRSMEGIVRQIWKSNPAADIVFIYTTTLALAPAYDKGEIPKAVQYDHAIAAHYGIPEVNVGQMLWKAIADKKGTWETLTKDTVHPSDEGYAIYSEMIAGFLKSHQADLASPFALPEPLVRNALENGQLVDAWTIDAGGWDKENKKLGNYPHRIAANKPGTELVYRFTGTAIGVFWLIAPDSGDIEWSIDGGTVAKRSSWDKYALKYSRANYAIFNDNLPPGEHVLKIKVLDSRSPESTGTWVRIGAMMVNGGEAKSKTQPAKSE